MASNCSCPFLINPENWLWFFASLCLLSDQIPSFAWCRSYYFGRARCGSASASQHRRTSAALSCEDETASHTICYYLLFKFTGNPAWPAWQGKRESERGREIGKTKQRRAHLKKKKNQPKKSTSGLISFCPHLRVIKGSENSSICWTANSGKTLCQTAKWEHYPPHFLPATFFTVSDNSPRWRTL